MTTSDMFCPHDVRERIRTVDLRDSENSTLFAWIGEHAALACQVYAVGAIAGRLGADADPQVIDDFCAAAATYAGFLGPADRSTVRDAYLRIPYHAAIAMNYFAGLRLNHLDIRAELTGKVDDDWTFVHPRRDAATWHYTLYLASLDTPGAHAALAAKLAATTNGNDLTNLIRSLAELRTPQTADILREYSEDTRTADGTVGPGMQVGATVKILLAAYVA